MKIAIQGIEGAFHHLAAEQYFLGNALELVPCERFSDMPDTLLSGAVDYGVMAIENTIAGAILPNYALIDQYKLDIIGECFLPINHQLMALYRTSIEEITAVYSHPMALLQCSNFFKQYPHIRLVEDTDTALVARRISQEKISGIAAIGAEIAADIYGLDILSKNIQTEKRNFTRFFIISKPTNTAQKTGNKVTCRFTLPHETGSLGNLLMELSKIGVNLTKIQSLPIIEQPWKYAFFVDFVAEKVENLNLAKKVLTRQTADFCILGQYEEKNKGYENVC